MEQYAVYRFFAADNEKIEVRLDFDAITFELLPVAAQSRPNWTRLDDHPCRCCSLPKESVFCPSALGIARFVGAFDSRFSYEKAVVEIETPLRVVLLKSRFQAGMASLLGLVCATSGCPATQFLRPLVRFHFPFANEQEMLFHIFSASVLGLSMKSATQGHADRQVIDDLKEKHATLRTVMANLADRLRPVVKRYAPLNADILLDSFAEIAPDDIEDGLDALRGIFDL
jgi:hypothetical protein